MSIAQRVAIEDLKQRVSDLEKLVIELRESLAYLQGEHVGKKLASRETLTLEKRKSA